MSVRIPVLVNRENLNRLEAEFHVSGMDPVVATVQPYTFEEYKETRKLNIMCKEGEADMLVVAVISCELPVPMIAELKLTTIEKHSFDYSDTIKPHFIGGSSEAVVPLDEVYTTMTVSDDTIEVSSYPEEVTCTSEIDEVRIKDEVEAIEFGWQNPFTRCDPAKIVSLTMQPVAVDSLESLKVIEHYYRLLWYARNEYGENAFPSLKRISGTYNQLNRFFSIFSNREFECMWVDRPELLEVDKLSVDVLRTPDSVTLPYRENVKFRRVKSFKHGIPPKIILTHDSDLVYEPKGVTFGRYPTCGVMDYGRDTEGYKPIFEDGDDALNYKLHDLRAYRIAEKVKVDGYYQYVYQVTLGGKPIPSTGTTCFSLVIDFKRYGGKKNANF